MPAAAAQSLQQHGLAPPFKRLLITWLIIAAALSPVVVYTLSVRLVTNTETFFLTQDLPVLALYVLVMIPIGLFGGVRIGLVERLRAWPARRQVALMAGVCLVTGALGQWLLFDGYTLSLNPFSMVLTSLML